MLNGIEKEATHTCFIKTVKHENENHRTRNYELVCLQFLEKKFCNEKQGK